MSDTWLIRFSQPLNGYTLGGILRIAYQGYHQLPVRRPASSLQKMNQLRAGPHLQD